MNLASPAAATNRPIVILLFLATCLLSIVSYFTTQQGMALYLSPWFATLAALGIQVALVMVAWLVGLERRGRPLLIAVYVATALVSIAFSYVSLHTWFSSRERPAEIQRALYDELQRVAGRAETLLAEAAARSGRYIVALEEMTEAERKFGHISRAGDADPYLDQIRAAVAREAQTYREGAGPGVRYTAFERHTKLTAQVQRDIEQSRRQLTEWRSAAQPLEPADQQLRRFRAVFDPIPWPAVEQVLGRKLADRPAAPDYAAYLDRTASGQEALLQGFIELFTAPGPRHYFAFALALFIDVVVFLLAFATGPYFHGDAESRWRRGAAAVDALDEQVFARGFVAKLMPSPRGVARVAVADLTAGERQLALALETKGEALIEEQEGRLFYLIDRAAQQRLLESLADARMPLRTSTAGGSAS
ncbi:MAG: hypothetical protein K2Q23_09915 [Bryobacteraceae bacterium]|nr:hypothetical protein [Bryobacteraceae bacterium]